MDTFRKCIVCHCGFLVLDLKSLESFRVKNLKGEQYLRLHISKGMLDLLILSSFYFFSLTDIYNDWTF